MTVLGRLVGPPFSLCTTLLLASACSHPIERSNARELERIEASLASPVEPTPRASIDTSFDGSLEGYLTHALANSPELRAAYEEWRAASFKPDQRRKWPDFQVSVAGFVRAVETRVGPQRLRVGAQQWFPWPTQLTKGPEAAAIAARAQGQQFEAEALEIAAEVIRAYWQVWAIQQSMAVEQEQVVTLEALSEQVRTKVEVGGADLADLAQVDLRLARTRDLLQGLQVKRRKAAAGLAEAVGVSPTVSLPVRADAPVMRVPAEDRADLIASALEHPRVEAMNIMSQSQEAEVAAARATLAPSFGLGVDWILTGDSPQMMPPPDSGKDAVVLTGMIKIPIDVHAKKAQQKEARARSAAYRSRAHATALSIEARIDQQLAELDDDLRRVRLYETTLLPQAHTAFEAVVGSYAAGRATVAELLIAQQSVLEIEEALLQARAEVATDLGQLERWVGRPIDLVAPSDELDPGETAR